MPTAQRKKGRGWPNRPSGKRPKVPTYTITDLGREVGRTHLGVLVCRHRGYRVSWGSRWQCRRDFATHREACAWAAAEIARVTNGLEVEP
jgi:hypothetical protein